MKQTLFAIAAGAVLLGSSGVASAVDIGGINIPVGPIFAVAQIYENVVTAQNQVLTGYGKVDSINGKPVGDYCNNNCELTYTFGSYVVTSITPTQITFTGGLVSFYLGFGADKDFSITDSPANDLAQASNGTLFLALKGHAVDALGSTFIGTGQSIGTASPTGFGTGLADVDFSRAALANSFFDTNGVNAAFGGRADLELSSSFRQNTSTGYESQCPSGPACLSGSADFRGTVAAIPEPGTYALLLAGLGAVGFVARRRRN